MHEVLFAIVCDNKAITFIFVKPLNFSVHLHLSFFGKYHEKQQQKSVNIKIPNGEYLKIYAKKIPALQIFIDECGQDIKLGAVE